MHKILWRDSNDLGQGRDNMQTVPSSLFISGGMAAGSLGSPQEAQRRGSSSKCPLLAFLAISQKECFKLNLVPYNIAQHC